MKKTILFGLVVALAMISCKDQAKEKAEQAAKEKEMTELQNEIKAIDSTIVEMSKLKDDISNSAKELDNLLNEL